MSQECFSFSFVCLTGGGAALTLAGDKMDSIYFSSIAEVVGKIRTREISPREIIDAHLARIEKLQPKLLCTLMRRQRDGRRGRRKRAFCAETRLVRYTA